MNPVCEYFLVFFFPSAVLPFHFSGSEVTHCYSSFIRRHFSHKTSDETEMLPKRLKVLGHLDVEGFSRGRPVLVISETFRLSSERLLQF